MQGCEEDSHDGSLCDCDHMLGKRLGTLDTGSHDDNKAAKVVILAHGWSKIVVRLP